MNVCYSELLHVRRTNYRIQGVFELSCNGALSEKLPFRLKFGLYRNLFYSGFFYPYFTVHEVILYAWVYIIQKFHQYISMEDEIQHLTW